MTPVQAALPHPFSKIPYYPRIKWLNEERDILADYRRLFGSEPRRIGAIAIMTDTDNTSGEATAWYGDLRLSSGR